MKEITLLKQNILDLFENDKNLKKIKEWYMLKHHDLLGRILISFCLPYLFVFQKHLKHKLDWQFTKIEQGGVFII